MRKAVVAGLVGFVGCWLAAACPTKRWLRRKLISIKLTLLMLVNVVLLLALSPTPKRSVAVFKLLTTLWSQNGGWKRLKETVGTIMGRKPSEMQVESFRVTVTKNGGSKLSYLKQTISSSSALLTARPNASTDPA